jgi:hypothetical protein
LVTGICTEICNCKYEYSHESKYENGQLLSIVNGLCVEVSFRCCSGDYLNINTLSECYYLLLHYQTFYDSSKCIAQYCLLTNQAVHLSAKTRVQDASSHRRPYSYDALKICVISKLIPVDIKMDELIIFQT